MSNALSVILRHAVPPATRTDGPAAERLYAFTIESALPLIDALRRLAADGVDARFTAVITPLLAEMWSTPGLQDGINAALDARIDAADGLEKSRLTGLRRLYRGLDGDLCRAYADLAATGLIELATTPATDAILPLIGDRAAARPQIAVAVATHTRLFGSAPRGIDLSRGYAPRLDLLCAEYGVQWCLVGQETFARATAKPVGGVFAPLNCPKSGVMAFAADVRAAEVPGIFDGDVFRDRGLIEAGLHLSTHPDALGLAPSAVRTLDKAGFDTPWSRTDAEAGARLLAEKWVAERAAELAPSDDDRHQCALFDAALFGRFWTSGHAFLMTVARHAHRPMLTTPGEWAAAHPLNQSAWPGLGRIGPETGFGAAAADPDREWLLRALPDASVSLRVLADRFEGTVPDVRAPVEDAARALLMAQCGDWQAMIADGRSGAEALVAVRDHLGRFEARVQAAKAGERSPPTDAPFFADLELSPFASW